jgi:hypothetical protein
MANDVFVVQHVRRDGLSEDVKFIGVYSTREEAERATERLKLQPGFRDHPNGFDIDPYTLDADHWAEGFGPVSPEAPEESSRALSYMCCYCYEGIPNESDEPVQIFARGARDEGEQGLFAHLACFKRALHPRVPVGIALDGEE